MGGTFDDRSDFLDSEADSSDIQRYNHHQGTAARPYGQNQKVQIYNELENFNAIPIQEMINQIKPGTQIRALPVNSNFDYHQQVESQESQLKQHEDEMDQLKRKIWNTQMHAYNDEGIPDVYKLSLRERVALKLNKANHEQ